MNLPWPPPDDVLQKDRKIAFEAWGESTRWVENPFSNFLPYKRPLRHSGLEFNTAKAFYQAMKSNEEGYREAIAKCETPGKTKYLARKCILRPDWDQIKIPVMNYAQTHKINTDPEFRKWLSSTIGHYIYEFNNWSDLYWGVSIYTGEGSNILGRILQNLREIHFEDDIPF